MFRQALGRRVTEFLSGQKGQGLPLCFDKLSAAASLSSCQARKGKLITLIFRQTLGRRVTEFRQAR